MMVELEQAWLCYTRLTPSARTRWLGPAQNPGRQRQCRKLIGVPAPVDFDQGMVLCDLLGHMHWGRYSRGSRGMLDPVTTHLGGIVVGADPA